MHKYIIMGLAIMLFACGIANGQNLQLNVNANVLELTPQTFLTHPAAQKKIRLQSPLMNKIAKSMNIVLQKTPYTAIRTCDLFKPYHIEPSTQIKFTSSDGFAVYIPAKLLLNCKPRQPVAWLALEEPSLSQRYPGKTAGPYLLAWHNADPTQVSQEYRPWQITHISVAKNALMQEYGSIYPKNNPRLQKGFDAFIKNCAVCHTLNHVGSGNIGPDLNKPMSPTQYFAKGILKKYIRQPEAIRKWQGAKMPAIPKETLSNEDLDALIAYLTWVAKTF